MRMRQVTSTSYMILEAKGKRRKKVGNKDANIPGETKAIELQSPTSISMKNSFIIKNADASFD